ncbi:MAG: DUF3486 family protein [Oscillospiraceae bacterium]|jgi:hypothetical protein|nr:DUF3486 family protein [Oscillospiraceae bacterium]
MKKRNNRNHSSIEKLPPSLRDTVEEMLLIGSTYREIIEYVASHGEKISQSALSRYFIKFNDNLQVMQLAQESANKISEMLQRYPEIDFTEGLALLTSQNLFSRLADAQEDEWKDLPLEKVVQQVSGLTRAVAHKRQVDAKTADDVEKAIGNMQGKLFEVLRREQPELYAKLNTFLREKKREGLE